MGFTHLGIASSSALSWRPFHSSVTMFGVRAPCVLLDASGRSILLNLRIVLFEKNDTLERIATAAGETLRRNGLIARSGRHGRQGMTGAADRGRAWLTMPRASSRKKDVRGTSISLP